jgi:hypothetical protein
MVNAYDKDYTYRDITSLRSFITRSANERGTSKKASTAKKAPKRVEANKVRKAMRDAGVPASKIELVMFALASK